MKKTRTEALKTREYLMLAALDTFYLRGVSRASLNEIAQTAGVTRGALYWHFKNKEDLFDALFQHIFQDFRQQIAQDIATGSPDTWKNLRQAIINLFDRMQNNEVYRKFISILHIKCEQTEKNQAIVELIQHYNANWYNQLSAALTICVKQGNLPNNLDIDLATIYLRSICIGLTQSWLDHSKKFNFEQHTPALIDAALHTIERCENLRHSN